MTILELAYVLLSILVAALVLYGYGHALAATGVDEVIRRSRLVKASAGILAWWAYTATLAYSDILQDFSLPPRLALLVVLPTFLFTGVLLYRERDNAILHSIPRPWPIFFQSFRILVETLFVFSLAAGVLHEEVTIEGYNFDMLVGVSAPVVGLLVYKWEVLSEKAALVWNYIGLLVLGSVVVVFITTIYFPHMWGSAVPLAPKAFATFPFVLVASFLMPVAVFVHVLSIVQLSRR